MPFKVLCLDYGTSRCWGVWWRCLALPLMVQVPNNHILTQDPTIIAITVNLSMKLLGAWTMVVLQVRSPSSGLNGLTF